MTSKTILVGVRPLLVSKGLLKLFAIAEKEICPFRPFVDLAGMCRYLATWSQRQHFVQLGFVSEINAQRYFRWLKVYAPTQNHTKNSNFVPMKGLKGKRYTNMNVDEKQGGAF